MRKDAWNWQKNMDESKYICKYEPLNCDFLALFRGLLYNNANI